MKASSAQLLKEARQMAWPWAAVMAPALVFLASHWFGVSPANTRTWFRFSDGILGAGTFFGALLLAALPLGTEFQYRTLAMRLAQPVQRRAFWLQKFLLTIAAVVPPAVLYCVAIGFRYGRPSALMTAAWIVVILAGGMSFTLLTRSTMGGVVLNTSGGFGVTLAWMYYERHGQFPPGWLWAIGLGIAAYVVFAVWLGRHLLLRFQAVDGMQAGEAFVPGARLLPRFAADWFRCRPTQPLRNLVRREFRLLRALWPLSLLYVVAWICLIVFRHLPGDRPESQLVPFGFTAILGVLIAVLAGTLSLGEEKTWGTHDWHMTMPLSVSLQWAVKLLFALFTSLVCTALLPLSILFVGGRFTGSPGQFLTSHIALGWMAEAMAITLIAFWCACVVKGTVQATIWVFPLCWAVWLGFQAGSWVLDLLAHPFHALLASVVSRLDAIAVSRAAWGVFSIFGYRDVVALVIGPLLAVGLIQSHRLFRAQVGANRLRVLRCALPLMLVAFLCSVVGETFLGTLNESWQQQTTILRETDSAIAALQAAVPVADAGRARRLSFAELANASPLSPGTQRWLHQASITVAPAPSRSWTGPGPYFSGRIGFVVQGAQMKNRIPYSAVVRGANGSGCSLMFQVQKQGPVGFLTAICD